MTKENYELYLTLKKELEDSAMEFLNWYHANIQKNYGWEHLEFECIEDGELWFEGYDYSGCYTDSFQETIKLDYLFLDDLGRKHYADAYHQKQAEKFKRDKMNRAREAEEREELLKKERYEQYLELQKEFGDELNAKEAK